MKNTLKEHIVCGSLSYTFPFGRIRFVLETHMEFIHYKSNALQMLVTQLQPYKHYRSTFLVAYRQNVKRNDSPTPPHLLRTSLRYNGSIYTHFPHFNTHTLSSALLLHSKAPNTIAPFSKRWRFLSHRIQKAHISRDADLFDCIQRVYLSCFAVVSCDLRSEVC